MADVMKAKPARKDRTGNYLCCAIFSFSGLVILACVGILVKYQSLYIHGLDGHGHDDHSGPIFISGGIYGVIMVICAAMYKIESKRVNGGNTVNDLIPRENSYYAVEDTDEEPPRVSPAPNGGGALKV